MDQQTNLRHLLEQHQYVREQLNLDDQDCFP